MTTFTLPSLAAVLLTASPARSNGQISHLWISERAIELLPDGDLHDLMDDPAHEDMWRNGSMFPDGGYAIGDAYGESAHWETFQLSYTDWIRTNYGAPPYEGEGAEHVAFLMGMASHGMADQVYDSLYMQRAHQEDEASDWDNHSMDEATDVAMAGMVGEVEYGELWVPDDVMAQVFADYLDYEVSADTIRTGQAMVRVAPEWAIRASQQEDVLADYHAQFPWACAHQIDPLVWGNPLDEAEVVARYWQEIWGRLQGEELVLGQVLATFPPDGGTGHQVESDLTTARVSVVFAHGLSDVQSEVSALQVLDPNGEPHSTDLWLFYGDHSHVLHAMPRIDWAPQTAYTVAVAGNATFTAGVGDAPTGGQASSTTFTTRSVWEPRCAAGASPRPSAWFVTLTLGGLVVMARRRRTNRR